MAKGEALPRFEFPIVVPITDERLARLEELARIAREVEIAGYPVLGLDNVVGLARRCLALEAALRGDPGHDVTAAVVKPTQDRTKSVWNWERMGRALLATTGPFPSGRCRVCACTRITACDVSTDYGSTACSWIEGTDETLCSRSECVAAAIASGAVTPPPCFTPNEAIERFLPPEIEGKAGTFEVSGSNGLEGIAAGVVYEPLPPASNEERECAPMAKVAGSEATLAPGRHDRGWRGLAGLATGRGWTNR